MADIGRPDGAGPALRVVRFPLGRRPTTAAVAVLTALAVLVLLATAVASSFAAGRSGGANGDDGVTATLGAGRRLPADPRLDPGARVVITVTGYQPGAPVTVGMAGIDVIGTAPADPSGRLVYRYTVPRTAPAGRHALLFVGRPRTSDRTRGSGDVVVSAPLTRIWRFRTPGVATPGPTSTVPGGSGSGAAGAVTSAASRPGGDGAHGTTSLTGADVRTLLAAAALALAGGVGLLAVARRRRNPRH